MHIKSPLLQQSANL